MKYLLLLCCALPLYATVIVQKNGDVISGTIAEEKPDRYVFQSPYGKLQIKKSNISKLILDEKTIELKTITHNDKTVQARLVSDENNKQIYLTEDGQTIRKEAEPQPATPAVAPQRDSILISAAAGYGWSSFQQVDTDPGAAGSGMPPLEQKLHAGTLAFSVAGHYLLSSYWGIGIAGSAFFWKGTAGISAPAPQISYDSEIRNSSVLISPSLVFSLAGNLGVQRTHDFRLELQPGVTLNSARIDLALRNPAGNYPTSASAAGNKLAFGVEAKISYLFSLSDSLRLKTSFSYMRIFHAGIYDSGLSGNTSFPVNDQFKNDFDSVLKREAVNPQILAGQLGIEYGF